MEDLMHNNTTTTTTTTDRSVPLPQTMRVVEALLFAAQEPLSTAALYEHMPAEADVGGALMQLQKEYEGRGVVLREIDGKWAFRTADDLGDIFTVEKNVERKLSRVAMETLAIIGYHQPVTRAEIENIRGVSTHRGTLDVLVEAGWVKPGRRRETPGRPLTWVTTTVFLDQFGLDSLNDLPGLDDLKAGGLLDKRPAIEAFAQDADLFDNTQEDGMQDRNSADQNEEEIIL
jgi:segregation and condensation protein B